MKNILVALIILVYCSSCQKEYSEQFVAYSNNPLNNDTSWKVSNASSIIPPLFNAALTDSFDLATGAEIHFPDSMIISFPPNACIANGSLGKIKVEVVRLRKKGDFIRYAKPSTSYNYLLQTGGSFRVTLSQNNVPVQLAQGISYKIKYTDPAPVNDMKFFYEDIWINNNDTTNTWLAGSNNIGSVATWAGNLTPQIGPLKGYEITSSKLHWINCDFFNDTTPTLAYTRLNVSMPLNFTNGNTSVYIVFKNKNIVAALRSDFVTKTFYFPKMPANSTVTLVSISKIGNDYYLGKKETTVTNASLISVNPEPKSLADISNYLNSL